MADRFRVLPLPAYDIQGHAIHLNQYANALKGADVAIRFNLKHWGFREHDTIVADIINMRVLAPPISLRPPKRKFSLTDPFDPKFKLTTPKKSRTKIN